MRKRINQINPRGGPRPSRTRRGARARLGSREERMMTTQRDDIIELMNSEHRLREEANRLSAENDELKSAIALANKALDGLGESNEQLNAENARLREALGPLAEAANIWEETDNLRVIITLFDCIAAREALGGEG